MENPPPHPDLDELVIYKQKYYQLRNLFTVLIPVVLLFFGYIACRVYLMIGNFEQIFAEMLSGKALPLFTQWIITAYRFGGVLPGLALITILPISAAILSLTKRDSFAVKMYSTCVLVFLLCTIAIIPFAMYLPMITIIKAINS